MNLVDASGWVEFFFGEANTDLWGPVIEDTANLLVPVLCLCEIFKRINVVADELRALQTADGRQCESFYCVVPARDPWDARGTLRRLASRTNPAEPNHAEFRGKPRAGYPLFEVWLSAPPAAGL